MSWIIAKFFRRAAVAAVSLNLGACAIGNSYGGPEDAGRLVQEKQHTITDYLNGSGGVVECLEAEQTLAQWSVNGRETTSINAAFATGGCDANPHFRSDFQNAVAQGGFSRNPYNNNSVAEIQRESREIGQTGLKAFYNKLMARKSPSF